MVGKAALLVLSKVNAPYGTNLTPVELAAKITDMSAASDFDASAFSFFSEVSESLQRAFVEEMELDVGAVSLRAQKFELLAGFALPLARNLMPHEDADRLGTFTR